MRGVVRHIVVLLSLCLLLGGATSCNRQRTTKHKFQVVSVDGLTGSIGQGWNLTLTIANNTGANVHITDGKAMLRYKGRNVGHVALNGEVSLPRRKCSKVDVPLRATFTLNILPILGKIRKGDLSGLTIDYELSVRAMSRNRTIEQKAVPLETLAKQFNFGLKQ